MRFHFILILFLGTVCLQEVAASDSLFIKIRENLSPSFLYTDFVYEVPAAKVYTLRPDITEFNLTLDRSGGKAQLQQNGTRKDEYRLSVDTRQHLANGLVWGNVTYRRGNKDNVKWNESSDYEIIYPYVVNDTIGGSNLQLEEYSFSGGYAWFINRWTLGLELDYRALKEYRTSDPRPDNTSSDLYFRIGGTYPLSSSYIGGASLSLRKYKQHSKLEFYSDLGAPWIYHDTGLGNNAYMFSGIRDESMIDGNAWQAAIQLIPQKSSPWNVSVNYNHFQYDKQLPDVSYLPISYIDEDTYSAQIAYINRKNNYLFGVKTQLSYRDRTGTEDLFSIVSGSSYEKIVSVKQYQHKVTTAQFSLIAGKENNKYFSWHLSPYIFYENSKESYLNPSREISFIALSEGINGYSSVSTKKVLFSSYVNLSFKQNLSNNFRMTGLAEDSYAYQIQNRNFSYLSAGSTNYEINLRGDFLLLKNAVPFVGLSGVYRDYTNGSDYYNVLLSLGISF